MQTLDNQEGEIEVGDKVVTGFNQRGGSATSNPIQTPTFEDATIKLTLKPFISPASEMIRMEIKQQVKQLSTASSPKAFQDSTQPIASRNIKTVINVRNGDTAILGGLMKESDVESISKVPLLGDIPILGWLFKSRSIQKQRTNMVVFLTPKIVRSSQDGKQIVLQKLDERVEFVKTQGGVDPCGKKMDELRQRAEAPPAADAPVVPSKVEE